MKKLVVLSVVAALAFASSMPAAAQTAAAKKDEVKYFQLSLWKNLQVYDKDSSIHGVRLAIYGANRDVFGLDLGLAVDARRDLKGVQIGFISWARRDCVGWQQGFFAVVKREMTGVQTGFFNGAKKARGFQFGVFNMTTEATGFQLGLINKATWLKGIQIGLLNIATEKDNLPILPIVNWNF